MKHNLTMRDIAKELGLSRVTVSVILNGRARKLGFAEKTIKRVENYLAKRGYVPSKYATELRAAPEKVVGLLHYGRLYSHLTDAFNRLIENISASGLKLEIMVVPEPEISYGIRELVARRVSNIIWMHNGKSGETYLDESVKGYFSNINTVIYNYEFGDRDSEKQLLDSGVSLVGVNRAKDTRRLADMIYRLGHRRILMPDISTRRHDHKIYAGYFVNAGLETCPFPRIIKPDKKGGFGNMAKCAENIRKAIHSHGITAAVFHGDALACRVIQELHRINVRVPEDITVTGFDGISYGWVFTPELTTLRMPVGKMVSRTVGIVEGSSKPGKHCFDLDLVEGKTHAPPAQKP